VGKGKEANIFADEHRKENLQHGESRDFPNKHCSSSFFSSPASPNGGVLIDASPEFKSYLIAATPIDGNGRET
jgi:hypothetical protein